MEFMNQPFSGQLGDRLIELLESSDFHTLEIAVAFAKNSGVLRIKDSFKKFREGGGKVNIYVGVDLGGTSYEALTALLLHTDSLNVVHSESDQTFHSKIYQFSGKNHGLLVVGSHNLTGGGLWTNFESSLHIPTDGTDANEKGVHKEPEDYFRKLQSLKDSFMPITNQDEIDKLLQNDYVTNEIFDRVHRAKSAKKDGTRERLFGTGAPAKSPRLKPLKEVNTATVSANSADATYLETSDQNLTIWFETRKMTGGSRNILDLSKTSLLERGDPTGTPFDLGEEKFMRGGVEFFGLNPSEINQAKDITLNFEGIDYAGNTILFPEGDNANGTWRLQIKGVDSSNNKITKAFEAKGESTFLMNKVITFTKVHDDYFYMSIFRENALEGIKAASSIIARNGRSQNARYLGLL